MSTTTPAPYLEATETSGSSTVTYPQPAVETKAFSVSSLVLGLASLAFGYTFIVPIIGLVLGIMALKREPSSRAMTIWGIVLNGVTLAGIAIAILFGLTVLVPLGFAAAFAG